jgi:hypothetical protein
MWGMQENARRLGTCRGRILRVGQSTTAGSVIVGCGSGGNQQGPKKKPVALELRQGQVDEGRDTRRASAIVITSVTAAMNMNGALFFNEKARRFRGGN